MADKELDEEAEALVKYGQKTEEANTFMETHLDEDLTSEAKNRLWKSVKAAYKLGVIKGRRKGNG